MNARLQLIHYGAPAYNPALFMPISDEPYFVKPKGGLWASPVDSSWGWADWCEEENFGSLDESFNLDFVGNLLVIDNYDDLDALPWIEGMYRAFPSFQCLCVGGFYYDAIHLTVRGERETRYSRPRSLYGWDCESVLILNPNSIYPPT